MYQEAAATYMELPARQNQSFPARQSDPWWAASIVIIEFAMTVMEFYAFLPSLQSSLIAWLDLHICILLNIHICIFTSLLFSISIVF